MSRRGHLVALLTIAALALEGCGGGQSGASAGTSSPPAVTTEAAGLTLQMKADNDSGQDGTATLTPAPDGKTRVVLELANSPAGPQPSHINSGTCENLGEIVHILGGMRGGKIDANVDTSLDVLLAGQFAVSVARSPGDFDVTVSCAEIRR